jgi:hypothetical protein
MQKEIFDSIESIYFNNFSNKKQHNSSNTLTEMAAPGSGGGGGGGDGEPNSSHENSADQGDFIDSSEFEIKVSHLNNKKKYQFRIAFNKKSNFPRNRSSI